MNARPPITLTRDISSIAIPTGTHATLRKGQPVLVTHSLGGSYTIAVDGCLFRIEPEDADALGMLMVPVNRIRPMSHDRVEGHLPALLSAMASSAKSAAWVPLQRQP